MSALSDLWHKFRSKEYRHAFAASYFKRSIPFQITAMQKKLGWSQEKLAEAAGLTQGVVSRAENPNYGNLTFNTVLRIAAGLDVAFVGEFIPFSELAKRVENLSEESVQVATFTEDVEPQKEERSILADVLTKTILKSVSREPHISLLQLANYFRNMDVSFGRLLVGAESQMTRLESLGEEPAYSKALHLFKQALVHRAPQVPNPPAAGLLKTPLETQFQEESNG